MLDFRKIGPEAFEEALLSHLATVRDVNSLIDGLHPYSWACSHKNMRLLRHLLTICGGVNQRNSDGTTALTWAPNSEFTGLLVSCGATAIAEEPDDGLTSLHIAAERGRVDQIEILLLQAQASAVLEKFDYISRTPLACAVYDGHLGAVKCLLAAGANPRAVDNGRGGYTVLQFGLEHGYDNICKLLLEYGANMGEHFGQTPSPDELAEEQKIRSIST